MASVPKVSETSESAKVPLGTVLQAYLRFLLFLFLLAGAVFGAAGRTNLPGVWAYFGLLLLFVVVNSVVVFRTDPTLFQERMKPGPGGKDPHLRALAIPIFLSAYVVAGLDIGRFHWSGSVPPWVQGLGLALYALALALPCWAMSANRFFSSDARIQRDRGHHLVTGGPYRFVRHPGYAGAILMAVSTPLALGSYWAALPALPVAGLMLRRLFIEERLLRAELEGYAEYMQRVRYRLVPGLW